MGMNNNERLKTVSNMNQWLFDIPELNKRVELTCFDDGRVTRTVFPIRRMKREKIYGSSTDGLLF